MSARGTSEPGDVGSRPSGRGTGHSRDPADGGPEAGDPEVAAKNLCLRWLTVRAHSRTELATKLRGRGIPDDAAERALDRLVEVGLIDDAVFAAAFIASRHRDRGLGRAALRRELERKGIDRELADHALEAIDSDAERSRAAQMVAKKLDAAMYAGTDVARRRLLGMLARRGYSPAVAIAVVNDALRGFAEPWDPTAGDELGP